MPRSTENHNGTLSGDHLTRLIRGGNLDLRANWEWELVAPSYEEEKSFQCLFLYSYKSGCTETLLESGQNFR